MQLGKPPPGIGSLSPRRTQFLVPKDEAYVKKKAVQMFKWHQKNMETEYSRPRPKHIVVHKPQDVQAMIIAGNAIQVAAGEAKTAESP